jgi:hypothetical protein
MSAGVLDEICIFMWTFIGSIGSVAPTRRVSYSSLEIPAIDVLLQGASPANGRALSWHG